MLILSFICAFLMVIVFSFVAVLYVKADSKINKPEENVILKARERLGLSALQDNQAFKAACELKKFNNSTAVNVIDTADKIGAVPDELLAINNTEDDRISTSNQPEILDNNTTGGWEDEYDQLASQMAIQNKE